MGKCYDLPESDKAIRAICARVDGEWDHPTLTVIGPMTWDREQDILVILRFYGVEI